MLLVIDVGNTEAVLGVYQDRELRSHWRLSTKQHRTADEIWLVLKSWLDGISVSEADITGGVISSVVPIWTSLFNTLFKHYMGVSPLLVSSETDTGIEIIYDSPRSVGADRICNAVAGFAQYGGPLVVVDFGTATTFDVISERGEYLGGIIALGLIGASRELNRVAAKLPKVELIFPPAVIGTTTESSIQSGIMWGAVALIDGMIHRIEMERGWDNVRTIATGGLAEFIAEKAVRIDKVEPLLTLEGMRMIYQRKCLKMDEEV
ncbi:pantothenate kinase [bacterium I07]|nr:pantothenate kinase [bacterium I07]